MINENNSKLQTLIQTLQIYSVDQIVQYELHLLLKLGYDTNMYTVNTQFES